MPTDEIKDLLDYVESKRGVQGVRVDTRIHSDGKQSTVNLSVDFRYGGIDIGCSTKTFTRDGVDLMLKRARAKVRAVRVVKDAK